MLRKVGTQEWIFDECKKINAMLFRFKDKESPMGKFTKLLILKISYKPTEC